MLKLFTLAENGEEISSSFERVSLRNATFVHESISLTFCETLLVT